MIIYEAMNIVNGKRYIGQTILTLEHRKRQHIETSKRNPSVSIHFYKAIQKYGEENFQWKVIDTAETQDELNFKESYWIELLNTTDPQIGYNLKGGGHNPFLTEEVKRKIGDAQKGELNHMYGKYGKENPFAKRVMIVSTGEIFDSVSDLIRECPEYKNGLSKIGSVCRGARKTYKGQKFRYVDEQGRILKNDSDLTVRFLINHNTGEKFAKASFAFHKYKKPNQDKSVFYRRINDGFGVWNDMFWYYDDVDITNININQLLNK